ncbi:MAG TPA: type III PLP-dependent enzyme [Negativicutes bacterium]|nr:type III PLP-dependent enzyme [Negativicutes bacterium]
MQKEFHLSKADVKRLANEFGTPLLVLSVEQVKNNYRYLKEHMPRVNIHYAVKANPDERILRTLKDLGSCFDVASDGEILQLREMGIDGNHMVYANPIKPVHSIETARQAGILNYMVDSEPEIEKMARVAPTASILVRVRMQNPEALIDLNKKFGAEPTDVIRLLCKARDCGLDVAGLAFHVGSQSTQHHAYLNALKVCRKLFDEAAKEGLNLRVLDIGGGFPIRAPGSAKIDIQKLLTSINDGLKKYFPETEIWAEPGRFICGTSVKLITQVIGKQHRDNQDWYFLDEGIYGTFSGVIFDHWDFELLPFKEGPVVSATFAGPSCDSFDVIFREKETARLDVNDLILVPNIGSYSSASATTFNGFSKARTVIWEEVAMGIRLEAVV